MPGDEIILVCALADSPMMALGSVFNKFCQGCGRRVMIAPTGQKFLAEHPEAKIRCPLCLGLPSGLIMIPGSLNDLIGEVKTSRRNMRRYRN